jgi:hypothetical protein
MRHGTGRRAAALALAASFVLAACTRAIRAEEVRRVAAQVGDARRETREEGFAALRTSIDRPACHWPLARDAEPVVRHELVPVLVALLDAPERKDRERAADSLSAIAHRGLLPPPAAPGKADRGLDVPALLRALEREECRSVVTCFARLPTVPEAAVAPLARIARTDAATPGAFDALGNAGGPGRRELLAIRSDATLSSWKREWAANRLGEVALTDEEIEALLLRAETGTDPDDRRAALRSLRASAAPGAPWLVRLVPLLADADRGVTGETGDLLARARHDTPALRARVAALLRTGPRRGAAILVEALGATDDLVGPLASAVRDDAEEPATRRRCLAALKALKGRARGALPAIDHRLEHPADAPEWYAAKEARDAIERPWSPR